MNFSYCKRLLAAVLVGGLMICNLPCMAAVEINQIVSENFEACEPGEAPPDFEYGQAGGGVLVAQLYENRALWLQNQRDGSYTSLQKTFQEVSKVPLVISLRWMQAEAKTDGTVIAATGTGAAHIASLETENGHIVYKSEGQSQAVVAEDYLANRWYQLTLRLDLLAQTASVTVDGATVAAGLPVGGSKAEYFSSYTCYSPGYYVDDISVSTAQTAAGIEITGPAEISIPESGSRRYSFSAVVKDAGGIAVENAAVAFSPEGLPDGVSYEQNGNSLTLTVNEGAYTGAATIHAAYNDLRSTHEVRIVREQLATLEVRGPARISYRAGEKNRYRYEAVFLNGQQEIMEPKTVTWSLEGETPDAVSIDAESGVLTVSGELPRNRQITVRAVPVDEPGKTGSMAVTMLDWATYRQDEMRLAALVDYANEVLEKGRDKFQGTPLLADGINVLSEQPFEWDYPVSSVNPAPAVLSDLASQGPLMRILEGLSDLTYDETYRNRVTDIYQYYIDHYMTPSGLPYWGGHTAIDLKTSAPAFGSPDVNTHELKDNYPYVDPFYRLAPQVADGIMKGVWGTHIENFDSLLFNRHGSFSKEADLSWWNKPYDDESSLEELLPSTKLPFHMAGTDFIYMMSQCYKLTGDETALKWGRRLWKKYYDVCDPDTCLGGNVFTTAYGAEGTKDPMTLDPVGHWWDADPMPETYTYTTYGDRAYNQFADIMIEDGLIDESKRDMIREANVIFAPGYMTFTAQPVDILLAEQLAGTKDPKLAEWADEIMRYSVRRLASYGRLSYIPEQNKCKPIWTDGTDMTGYVVRRSGYFYMGYRNYTMRLEAPTNEMFYAYGLTYVKSMGRTDVSQEDMAEVWKVFRGMSLASGLGDLGANGPENPKVNLQTSSTNGIHVILLCYLYQKTGNTDYLDLARAVANNILAKHFHNNLFKTSANYLNIHFSGGFSDMPYALFMLEYTIRGRLDELELYIPCRAQFTADWVDTEGDGRKYWKHQSNSTVWIASIPSVKVQSVQTDQAVYTMQPGETREVQVSIYPSDAANKNIEWENANPGVARFDSATGILSAISKGKTIISGFSGDKNAFVEFEVHVE